MVKNSCKKILVTGGAGFIGSNLCESLLFNGHYVISLDNYCSGSIKNLKNIKDHKNFKIINADVSKKRVIRNIDEIYNLACPGSPVHYQKEPHKTIETSILGTFRLIELARLNNSKILFSSTSEVYGDPLSHPQIETYWGNVNPIGIRSCYDESKRCAETILMDEWRANKTEIKICRIFNTYGPKMLPNDGRVISNFIYQALNNKPITIYGNGSQTRSFCYIDDMINGIIAMMNSNKNVTGPINLGNTNEYTIYEIAKKIIKYTNSNSKILYKKLPLDDPRRRKPNINKAKKILKWKPSIRLNEGLKKTIQYFKKI
tara:strand:- start:8098 stop:9045 length:948 start_codon:yes stop_codon:yes gene_type:complete